MSLGHVAKLISEEVIDVWKLTTIPHKSPKAVTKSVKVFIEQWNKVCPEKRSNYEEQINCLFEVRPENLLDDQSLLCHWKRYSSSCWFEESQFFVGQLNHPQTSSILATTDVKKARKDEGKAAKREKFEQCRLYSSPSPSPTNKSVKKTRTRSSANCTMTSQQDAIQQTKGIQSQKLNFATETDGDDEIPVANFTKFPTDDVDVGADDVWEPSTWQKHVLKKLQFPARKLPSILACTSTTTKTSIRQELKLPAALIKAGGGDINKLSQSVSTIYRQRKHAVTETADTIRKRIRKSTDEFLVVHVDGKIIQLISGTVPDRFAICISIPNQTSGQFLASPGLACGTGENMAHALHDCLAENEIVDKDEAGVFDTTSSNSGKWRASVVVLLEELLQRVLLWLACRHHVSELCIKHAHEAVRGPSSGLMIHYSSVSKKDLVSMPLKIGTCGIGQTMMIGGIKRQSRFWHGQILIWSMELGREKTTVNFLSLSSSFLVG